VYGWTDITLNSTGWGWINKTGTTKLALRSDNDINNQAPPSGSDYYGVFYSGEQTYPPKLVINFHQVPPNPPVSLLTENQTNPTRLTTSAPRFSAVYLDNDEGDNALYAQVRVGTSPGDNSLWDSGWLSITPTENNTRCPDITYAGSALSRGATYFWGIRFKDNYGQEGYWSTENATFRLNQLPLAENQKVEGQVNPARLTTLTPTLSWSYYDPDGDTQAQYQIQVGTAENDNSMWDFTGSTSSTSAAYAGSTLSRGVTYYWRVRVNDGYEWSDWLYGGTFRLNQPPTAVIAYPDDGAHFYVNNNISFGSGSTDADNDNLICTWDFGDGTVTETGATAVHRYLISAIFVVRMTVSDGYETAQASVTLYIQGNVGGGGYVAPENLENIPGISPNAPPVQNLLMWPLFSAFGIVFSLWMLLAAIAIVAYLTDQKGIVIATVLMFAFLLVFGTKLVQFIMP
jgi:hypothetical protein